MIWSSEPACRYRRDGGLGSDSSRDTKGLQPRILTAEVTFLPYQGQQGLVFPTNVSPPPARTPFPSVIPAQALDPGRALAYTVQCWQLPSCSPQVLVEQLLCAGPGAKLGAKNSAPKTLGAGGPALPATLGRNNDLCGPRESMAP